MTTLTSKVFPFMIQQAQIALNNGDGTFGTPYKFISVNKLTLTLKVVSDRAQGNASVTALATQAISAEIALDTAGFEEDALNILTGDDVGSSGVGADEIAYVSMANERYPYFAFQAQAWPDKGDMLIWLPNCKVTTDFSWVFNFGKLETHNFKAEGIIDDILGYSTRTIIRKTKNNTLVFPPLGA